MAVSICLAFFPIFFPLAWMHSLHQTLGLGEAPREPIFEYLARSLSAMYFAHGILIFVVSTDVRRYWPFVLVLGCLNLFLGGIFWITDWMAPMPSAWMWMEGPPIACVGALLIYLHQKGKSQFDAATFPHRAEA